MPYDPDGDPEAFDPTNPDDVDAYLDHPNTHALHEDLAREFRALPPEEQLAELVPEMLANMLRKNEVAGLLADQTVDDATRQGLQRLYDALASEVLAYGARITELGGEPPEEPGPRLAP